MAANLKELDFKLMAVDNAEFKRVACTQLDSEPHQYVSLKTIAYEVAVGQVFLAGLSPM